MNNGLAIDIGGTFTDVVLELEGEIHSTKVLTSREDPSDAVMDGIEQIFSETGATPSDVEIILHGTTLATNALIERRGAKTALLTTLGHRDVLEMALENRFEQYDINIERPVALVPRTLRLPIVERMNAHGEVLIELDDDSVDSAIEEMRAQGVESVAIGFLHSYVNDEHELSVRQRVRDQMGDIPISLSSDVCPEIREYERMSTTCANAYVLPLMKFYLGRLSERFNSRGFDCPYLMMTSGGGLTTFETAGRYPIRLVESGPAGGAILAEQISREVKADKVISFDMGGTTAKLSLIDEGKTLLSRAFEVDRAYRFKKGSGLPVRIPVIEMVEIGAGGGSIAHLDKIGRIQIGPESAGSDPGPACYGNGGSNPTVTDADCVLDRLDPNLFAGGNLSLNRESAESAIDLQLAQPMKLSISDTAQGIAEIVDENMAAAARSHASEWGKSLDQRTMVAFGGAAPLHAARLLEKLNLACVVIPQDAGVGSAIGFLNAPISYEVVRSSHMLLENYDPSLVQDVLSNMREEASQVVESASSTGEFMERGTAYMRYVGQGHEISVPFETSSIDHDELLKTFESTYTSLYGRLIPHAPVEVMSWTLNVSAVQDAVIDSVAFASNSAEVASSHLQVSTESSESDGSFALLHRDALERGQLIIGPALVTERHTTTVVPAGFGLRRLQSDHLLMFKEEGIEHS
ncbi:MAG: hydantoinase/oxoprolinase family protein [Gammaproteobacteria bacterium]|nr:hydantoinase/oxoprolinase family protein [Gammaproteobacteria bacterium]MYD79416.1 hydantoinase/oxoprolinase family protein [Gammaproteobacteria bacterium]